MSSQHDQTDQILDALINGQDLPSTNNDDTDLMNDLVDMYRADTLAPSIKQRIWQQSRMEATQPKIKVRPVTRVGWQRKWVATLALIICGGLFLGYPYVSQLGLLSDTPLATEVLLPTPTVQPLTPLLLHDVPQISPAFDFSYGGYVYDVRSTDTLNLMNNAMMDWVALELTTLDRDPTELRQQITDAHERGFLVFVSVRGTPSQSVDHIDNDIQDYADYVGQLASWGVDAIELWSEANLSRSWLQKQGLESYVQLLQQSADAIRNTNEQTIIISGAPAPTGAESAFEGQVLNDDNFLRHLYQRGALENVDCVGMHYVEGIVPPLSITGDSRDDDYRRYLPTMLQTYRQVVQAEIPLCITEIGYFNAQGLDDVPIFFQWANQTTTADQQRWLTDAMEWLSLQVDVPLAMIWHVNLDTDSTLSDENLQITQGYALWRD